MSNVLNTDQQLTLGQSIQSPNGCFILILQTDGNIVMYHREVKVGLARWATNTYNKLVSHAIMQPDGNFVLYRSDKNTIWATHTHMHGSSRLVMQNDGNLVVYRNSDDKPVWASNTVWNEKVFYATEEYRCTKYIIDWDVATGVGFTEEQALKELRDRQTRACFVANDTVYERRNLIIRTEDRSC